MASIGDRVKLRGRRVAATVTDVIDVVHTKDGDVVKMPGDQGESVGQIVLLEFDKPVRYNSSKTPFLLGWFGATDVMPTSAP